MVTADGAGDLNWASVSVGENGKLDKLATINRKTSLGLFYAAVTKFLKFRPHRHEENYGTGSFWRSEEIFKGDETGD